MELEDLEYQKRCMTYSGNMTIGSTQTAHRQLLTVSLLWFPPLLDVFDYRVNGNKDLVIACGPLHELLIGFTSRRGIPYEITSVYLSAPDLAQGMMLQGPASDNHLDVVTLYPPLIDYYDVFGKRVSHYLHYDAIDSLLSRMVPPLPNRFGFLRSFQPTVWIIMTVALVLVSIALMTLEGELMRSLWICIQILFGEIDLSSSRGLLTEIKRPQTIVLLATWIMGCFILTSSFAGTVTSHLLNQKEWEIIDDPNDLLTKPEFADAEIMMMVEGYELMVNGGAEGGIEYIRRLLPRITAPMSAADLAHIGPSQIALMERVINDGAVLVFTDTAMPYGVFMFRHTFDLRVLHISRHTILSMPYFLPIETLDPSMVRELDQYLSHLTASGLYLHWIAETSYKLEAELYRYRDRDEVDRIACQTQNLAPVSLRSLEGIFIIYGSLTTLSVISSLCSILIGAINSRSQRESNSRKILASGLSETPKVW